MKNIVGIIIIFIASLLLFGCGLFNQTKANTQTVVPIPPELFIVSTEVMAQVKNFYYPLNAPFNQGSLGDCMGESFVGATGYLEHSDTDYYAPLGTMLESYHYALGRTNPTSGGAAITSGYAIWGYQSTLDVFETDGSNRSLRYGFYPANSYPQFNSDYTTLANDFATLMANAPSGSDSVKYRYSILELQKSSNFTTAYGQYLSEYQNHTPQGPRDHYSGNIIYHVGPNGFNNDALEKIKVGLAGGELFILEFTNNYYTLAPYSTTGKSHQVMYAYSEYNSATGQLSYYPYGKYGSGANAPVSNWNNFDKDNNNTWRSRPTNIKTSSTGGGHYVIIFGYATGTVDGTLETIYFIRNSWGNFGIVGQNGNMYMTEEFLKANGNWGYLLKKS